MGNVVSTFIPLQVRNKLQNRQEVYIFYVTIFVQKLFPSEYTFFKKKYLSPLISTVYIFILTGGTFEPAGYKWSV